MIDTSIVRAHQHAACITQADPAKNVRPPWARTDQDVDKTQALRKPGKRDHSAAQTLRWLMAPAHRRLWAAVEIEPGHLKGRNRHRLPLDGDIVMPPQQLLEGNQYQRCELFFRQRRGDVLEAHRICHR